MTIFEAGRMVLSGNCGISLGMLLAIRYSKPNGNFSKRLWSMSSQYAWPKHLIKKRSTCRTQGSEPIAADPDSNAGKWRVPAAQKEPCGGRLIDGGDQLWAPIPGGRVSKESSLGSLWDG